MLKQDYKDDCNLDDALMLAVKVLNKTLDSTRLSADKGENINCHSALQYDRD